MNIVALKTDGQEAYLALYQAETLLTEEHWDSGRELGRDLIGHIKQLLQHCELTFSEIEGIVYFAGPGSFTSLRIGAATVNTLAYANSCMVVSETGDDWLKIGIQRLLKGENEAVVLPKYGSEPHITPSKK